MRKHEIIKLTEALADTRGTTPVGWRVGADVHPANVNQIVLGAQRVKDGAVFFHVMGRVDVVKPYTDEEFRAKVMHEWGKFDEGERPPEVIRLAAAQVAVEKWR